MNIFKLRDTEIDEANEDNNCLQNEFIAPLMEGDADLNGCVDIVDAMFIAQYVVQIRTFTADQLNCADTTDDGEVDIIDAMHIAQWIVDPDGGFGVLFKPLWETPLDDSMLPPGDC